MELINFSINGTLAELDHTNTLYQVFDFISNFYHKYLMILFVLIIITYLWIDQRKKIQELLYKIFPESYLFGIRNMFIMFFPKMKTRKINFVDIYFLILQMLVATMFVTITGILWLKVSPSQFGL